MAAAAVLTVSCSSSKKPATTSSAPQITAPTTSAATSAPATTAPATTAPATSAATAGPLSGSWKGTYSGAFTGTFTLTWQQSGSALTGNISLSTAGTLPINGTVTGGSIRFGTVGSTAITYTGTVSGGSMSGSYQVAGSGGGSWSATKSS